MQFSPCGRDRERHHLGEATTVSRSSPSASRETGPQRPDPTSPTPGLCRARPAGRRIRWRTSLDFSTVYNDIAGELHTEAGIGTSMNLAFNNIEVNGASFPGTQALQYVYIPPVSTHEFSYNQTTRPLSTRPSTRHLNGHPARTSISTSGPSSWGRSGWGTSP